MGNYNLNYDSSDNRSTSCGSMELPQSTLGFYTVNKSSQCVILQLYLWKKKYLTLHLFNLKLKCLLQYARALGVVT